MIRFFLYILGLSVLAPTAALADPVTIVVSAVAAYGAAGALMTMKFLYYFVGMLALSELAKQLAPAMGDMGVDGGYDVSGPDPTAHQQIIYGRTRIGGVVVFKETTDKDKFLHMVVAIAGHECESLEEIHFDDERLVFDGPLDNNVEREVLSSYKVGTANTNSAGLALYNLTGIFGAGFDTDISGLVRATFHNGAQTTSDSNLKTRVASWTSNHVLNGISYVYIRLEHDPEYFTSGEPRITFVVKGKKIYDPEDVNQSATDASTWTWSENPALCLRDYLTADYGLGCEQSEIDDVSFMQAKQDCILGDAPTFDYVYDTDKSQTAPTSGVVKTDSGALYSAGQIYISALDASGVDRSAFFQEAGADYGVIGNFVDSVRGRRWLIDSVVEEDGYYVFSITRSYGFIGSSLLFRLFDFEQSEQVKVSIGAIGVGPLYTTNGAFTTEATPENVINSIATSAAGNVFYSLGKFQFYAGVPRTATVTLTDDDLVSGLKVQTARTRRELYNEINGLYKSYETSWQKSDYPTVVSQSALEEDGSPSSNNVDLLFTISASMAKRIAKILLLKTRQQKQVQAVFGMKAAQLAVGDWVTYQNNRMGIDGTFEVVSWGITPNSDSGVAFDVTLQEISDAVYSWTADEEPDEINPPVVENTGRFVADVSVHPTATDEIINEHVITVLNIEVRTDDTSLLDTCIVEYKPTLKLDPNDPTQTIPTPDSEYQLVGQGSLGVFQVRDVVTERLTPDTPMQYTVRARGVNSVGTRGAYASATVIVSPNIDPPDDVTNFSANVNEGYTNLEWTPVENFDLSYYIIRHAVDTVGAKMSHATTAVEKVSRPASTVAVPARVGTYLIRAYDKLKIPSENATSVVITQDMLPSYTNNMTQSEHTTFSGTKTGVSVTSGNLRLSTYETAPSEGTYVFSNYIDTYDVSNPARKVRASMHCKLLRFGDNGLWDDVTGLLDESAGLWDNLTDGEDKVDVDVLFYISTTTDDPAGTPTWSDYQQFKAGDFYGRAFRFMVKLKSTSNDITPSISELTAKVEYN